MELLSNVPAGVAIVLNLIIVAMFSYEKISARNKKNNGNGYIQRHELEDYLKADDLDEIHKRINLHIKEENNHCAQRIEKCNEKFSTISTHYTRLETKIDLLLTRKGGDNL